MSEELRRNCVQQIRDYNRVVGSWESLVAEVKQRSDQMTDGEIHELFAKIIDETREVERQLLAMRETVVAFTKTL